MHAQIILTYFPSLSATQTAQIERLYDLYATWNAQINVISRKDIDNLYTNHVLHSLGIAKIVSFNAGASVLDVGTGGGFPGIPLAILFPQTQFTLVDSIGKKITVVKEVSNALQLKNVRAEKIRAEDVRGEFDFVVSRAVTKIAELDAWCRKKIKLKSTHELKNGMLALKGGDLSQEVMELGRPFQIFELSSFFQEEFFLTKKILYVPR